MRSHRVGRFRRILLVLLSAAAVAAILSGCTAAAPSAGATPSALPTDVSSAPASLAAPSAGSTPSALSTEGSSMQVSITVAQTVPAGGSVDVPLTFEQSPQAEVTLYTDGTPVTATIDGTSLAPSPIVAGSLWASLTNPTDGNLHIVNSGTAQAQVAVVVSIETGRTLTITAPDPAHQYDHGASVDFDVVLTEPQAGDTATAQLHDPTGTSSAITLTPAGAGHWTGHVTPGSGGGSYTIMVAVPGASPRFTSYEILVASGTVTLSSGFSERLVDSDHDGLANKLVLSPTVKYKVVGYLLDSTGAQIDVTGGDVDLVAGAQPLDLAFDGSTIYKSGKSGPYRLAKVAIMSGDTTEASAADMGLTQAHDYKVFQR